MNTVMQSIIDSFSIYDPIQVRLGRAIMGMPSTHTFYEEQNEILKEAGVVGDVQFITMNGFYPNETITMVQHGDDVLVMSRFVLLLTITPEMDPAYEIIMLNRSLCLGYDAIDYVPPTFWYELFKKLA